MGTLSRRRKSFHLQKGGKKEPIPRHGEIDEMLAKAIIKRNNLKGN